MIASIGFPIRKVLGGKYRLVERSGEGCYTVVFRAWQKELGRYAMQKGGNYDTQRI